MGPRLDPIKAKGKLIKVGFNITDLNETYGVYRNQIAEYQILTMMIMM
ncbi:MAG: hypothetical protein CM15mP33_04500 [Candidatus Neomarinimicrobiota bacterium]|nr:MAG: hypothetical protein CM15mP33_04500 [Candidatus Neomarinimicrobiota bacterium]